MKVFALPEQLGNAILNYLAKKPYAEVAALIAALNQMEEVPPAPLAVVKEKKGE